MSLSFWHHHYGISVPSLDAAIAWWERVLSFQLQRRFPIPSIPAEVAILANGPCHVELFEVPGAKPADPARSNPNEDLLTHGNKHPCFAIADVEDFAEELRARGADIVWVRKFEFGSNIFIRDNAGNLIEFVEKPFSDVPMASL